MKRLFWTALGASVGILAFREARKTAASMTPNALAASLVTSIKDFGAELRAGMAVREAELRADLGLDDADTSRDSGPGANGSHSEPGREHPFETRLRDGH